jgi:hypothetical protein
VHGPSRKLLASALFALAIFCCGSMPATARYAAAASAKQPTLLGSSQAIRKEFDALNVRRVARAFADVRVGSAHATVSPEDLQMMLGPEDPATTGAESADLATVEIETRAPLGIEESGPQAQIPFGFSGMVWGFRHPTQAWRLLMPVLGSDPK